MVGARSVAHEHVHPTARERFTVLNGWVRISVDGEERDLRAGETVEVQPGVRHDYWNPGPREAHVLVEVWEPGRFEEMMVALFDLAERGRVTDRGVPTLLQSALLAREYDDVVVFGGVLQKVVFAVLAPLARLRGLKPVPVPVHRERPAELAPVYGIAA